MLLLGPQCAVDAWQALPGDRPGGSAPVEVRQLPGGTPIEPYHPDSVVLVRPDGVIAQQSRGVEPGDLTDFARYIPSA